MRNYIAQCNDCDQFVMLSDRFRRELSALFGERPLPENICAINNPATFAFREIDFAKKRSGCSTSVVSNATKNGWI